MFKIIILKWFMNLPNRAPHWSMIEILSWSIRTFPEVWGTSLKYGAHPEVWGTFLKYVTLPLLKCYWPKSGYMSSSTWAPYWLTNNWPTLLGTDPLPFLTGPHYTVQTHFQTLQTRIAEYKLFRTDPLHILTEPLF